MSTPDFFPNDSFVIINHKESLLDLCLRNAMKYAIGEMKFTMELQNQLEYAWKNSNEQTRELLQTIFDVKLFLEDV